VRATRLSKIGSIDVPVSAYHSILSAVNLAAFDAGTPLIGCCSVSARGSMPASFGPNAKSILFKRPSSWRTPHVNSAGRARERPLTQILKSQCQKRPTTVSEETYYSVKRDLLQCKTLTFENLLQRSLAPPSHYNAALKGCCLLDHVKHLVGERGVEGTRDHKPCLVETRC
jgi:hypothetical protein